MTFAYMYFVEKKNSFSTKSPCQRDTVPVIFKIMYFLYFLMYFSYEKKEEGWPCTYSIWASTRSSSAPITPGTEGCSSSSGGGSEFNGKALSTGCEKKRTACCSTWESSNYYICMAIFDDGYCSLPET